MARSKKAQFACKICALNGILKPLQREKPNWKVGHYPSVHPDWNAERYMALCEGKVETPAEAEPETPKKRKWVKKSTKDGIAGALENLNLNVKDKLTSEEKIFFDNYVEDLYLKTDRDETQMPLIVQLAFDMIISNRVREAQLDAFDFNSTRTSEAQKVILLASDSQEKTLKEAQARVKASLESLGMSRKQQIDRGAAITSTPSSLVSGYLDEVERMSVDMLEALMMEERRVYAKMQKRIEEHILSKVVERDTEEDEQLDSGRIFSMEEALERAGVVTGGSYDEPLEDEETLDAGYSLPF